MDGIAAFAGISDKDVASRLINVEKENQDLRNSMYFVEKLKKLHIGMAYPNQDSICNDVNQLRINN